MKLVDLIGASMAAGDLGAAGKELVTADAVRAANPGSPAGILPSRLLYDPAVGGSAGGAGLADAGPAEPNGDPADNGTTAAEQANVVQGVPGDTGSEWGVTVVRLLGFEPIPGADFIHVARFTGDEAEPAWDYPVVVQKSQYKVGDRAVYVPVDSAFPAQSPEFAFLGSAARRLRAKKLRGVYSEGLLIPWADVASIVARTVPDMFGNDAAEKAEKTAEALDAFLPTGAEVSGLLGITRYREVGGSGSGQRGGRPAPDESVFPHYSVSNARKGEGIQRLAGDTRVIVTEKLHGANIRFGWVGDEGEVVGEREANYAFKLGSHRTMRDPAVPDWFSDTAAQHDLEEKSERCRGMVFYGEILGVQDLKYGALGVRGDYGLRVFDVYSTASGRWLNWGEVKEITRLAGLDHVPVLYDGPLDECNYREMAEGETTISGAGHVREGVVIRTFAGGGSSRRWKYVGQGYKLRKEQRDLVSE